MLVAQKEEALPMIPLDLSCIFWLGKSINVLQHLKGLAQIGDDQVQETDLSIK